MVIIKLKLFPRVYVGAGMNLSGGSTQTGLMVTQASTLAIKKRRHYQGADGASMNLSGGSTQTGLKVAQAGTLANKIY